VKPDCFIKVLSTLHMGSC